MVHSNNKINNKCCQHWNETDGFVSLIIIVKLFYLICAFFISWSQMTWGIDILKPLPLNLMLKMTQRHWVWFLDLAFAHKMTCKKVTNNIPYKLTPQMPSLQNDVFENFEVLFAGVEQLKKSL